MKILRTLVLAIGLEVAQRALARSSEQHVSSEEPTTDESETVMGDHRKGAATDHKTPSSAQQQSEVPDASDSVQGLRSALATTGSVGREAVAALILFAPLVIVLRAMRSADFDRTVASTLLSSLTPSTLLQAVILQSLDIILWFIASAIVFVVGYQSNHYLRPFQLFFVSVVVIATVVAALPQLLGDEKVVIFVRNLPELAWVFILFTIGMAVSALFVASSREGGFAASSGPTPLVVSPTVTFILLLAAPLLLLPGWLSAPINSTEPLMTATLMALLFTAGLGTARKDRVINASYLRVMAGIVLLGLAATVLVEPGIAWLAPEKGRLKQDSQVQLFYSLRSDGADLVVYVPEERRVARIPSDKISERQFCHPSQRTPGDLLFGISRMEGCPEAKR